MRACQCHFLGTGSIPTAERNSQSILLELLETKILIDCGEGTQRQLLKLGGSWSMLSSVFLTHHHIDHIYGIGGVVYAALLHTDLSVLRIYGPPIALEKARSLVDSVGTAFQSRLEWVEMVAGDTAKCRYFECLCFDTFHTATSLGYAFQIGKAKVPFLGDVALPNRSAVESIVSSVQNSDVLVSDAAHITAVEAATVARKAAVKVLYLVPISYDHSKEESWQQARAVFPDVCIPGDLDSFTIEVQT